MNETQEFLFFMTTAALWCGVVCLVYIEYGLREILKELRKK